MSQFSLGIFLLGIFLGNAEITKPRDCFTEIDSPSVWLKIETCFMSSNMLIVVLLCHTVYYTVFCSSKHYRLGGTLL